MATPFLEILIKRTRENLSANFFQSIIRLEVESTVNSAGSFRLRLGYGKDRSGHWTYPAEKQLQLFENISISAKLGGKRVNLFDGFITSMNCKLAGEKESFIDIHGIDNTVFNEFRRKRNILGREIR